MMNHNSRHILLWMKKKKRRSVRNTSQENRSGRLDGCRGWKIAKIFFLSPNWIRRLCYHKATWARLSTSFKSASESAVSYLPPFSFIWYLFVPHTPPLPLSIPYEFIEKARYQCFAKEEVPSLWRSTLWLFRYAPILPSPKVTSFELCRKWRLYRQISGQSVGQEGEEEDGVWSYETQSRGDDIENFTEEEKHTQYIDQDAEDWVNI